jgi:hypothetical protein
MALHPFFVPANQSYKQKTNIMKTKTILLSAFALATISAHAQKGSWYVGGNVGFSTAQNKIQTGSTETKNGKTTTWTFRPEFGTFLTDHVQLGIQLNANGSKTDQQNTAKDVTKSINLGAILYSRYFFGKDAFKPFVGVNLEAAPGKTKYSSGSTVTSETKNFNFGANVNAGFGYALSKRVTAVGSFGLLGYNHSTNKTVGSNTKYTTSTFGFKSDNGGSSAGTLGNRFTTGIYYTL